MSPREIIHRTPEEHAAAGTEALAKVPHEAHATWDPPAERADPVQILEDQATTRVPELLPIRYGRMVASPFAFYRGGAAIMAADLVGLPKSGLRAQLCGDAHLSNFGGFASPERDLIFDINDFDETLPGPWEWDVKRLAVSIVIAGRDRGFKAKESRAAARAAVEEYREAMTRFAAMRRLDVWYSRLDESTLRQMVLQQGKGKMLQNFDKTVEKARTKDSTRAFAKLTTTDGGEPRIKADPPLIVPIEDLTDLDPDTLKESLRSILHSYRRSLQGDRRRLLEGFELVHVARKVVGVGSVGTRAWVVLMLGRDRDDPLFLQFKESGPSVLAPFAGKSQYDQQGQRVVEGQRLMQASSDIFLGWDRVAGIDGMKRDFYVRQLWDWKTSVDVTKMAPGGLRQYGRLCGWTLARAHARSGDRIAIGAYLGEDDTFDRAVSAFAEAYADQNDRDYQAFRQAVEGGRLPAETGV
ncbi:MAG TPA: DUF2252 domain-containing protein [Actinomycetota bacterium]